MAAQRRAMFRQAAYHVLKSRWRRGLVLLVLLVAIVFGGYNALGSYSVVRRDLRVPRDPTTGIMLGAEPQTLGPEDAPVAVLLVHGYLGCGNNFADLPERLAARGWRVRVLLLPGHGTSPRDLENVTVDQLLNAVLAEAKSLQDRFGRVVLVGHSMGGALCTLAAAQTDVDGLVLAAPYFGVTRRWYYLLRPETWVKLGHPLVRWVYKGQMFIRVNRAEAKEKIISYAWVPTRSLATLMELGRRVNAPGILGKITCPVLLLHSRQDRAASPEAAAKAFDAMPAAPKRAVWLEQSDHILFWDHERDQVATEIERFIEGLL